MSALLKIILISLALVGVPAGYVFYSAVLSPDQWTYVGPRPDNWNNGGFRGAPGPIAGAGVPVIVIGYGAYWPSAPQGRLRFEKDFLQKRQSAGQEGAQLCSGCARRIA